MKKIWLVALFMVFSLALFACGGDRGGGSLNKIVEWYELSADADLDPDEDVTVTFWHRMGGESQALLQTWITEFEALYPNVDVVEEKAAGDYDALADRIALAIPGGNAPDISESYPDHIARYAPSGAPLALNSFISNPNIGFSEEEIADFLPGLWSEGTSYDNAGTILSLPFTKSTEAFFFNKTYFDQYSIGGKTYTEIVQTEGFTWDNVFEIAEDIKSREPNAIPFGYDSTDNLFISASEQWSAPYTGFNEETGRGEVQFNNDQSKEMVKYFKDKVDRGLMLTRSLNGDAYTSDIYKTGEQLYMYVGSTGGTRYAYIGMSSDVFNSGLRAGVAPLPSHDGVLRRQIQQGPNINLYKSDNEQQMIATWLFAKFITSAEKSLEFSLPSGYAPIRYSAYESDTWNDYVAGIKANPTTTLQAQDKLVKEAIEIFLNNGDIFFTSAVFNLSSDTRSEVGNLIDKILAYDAEDEDDLDDYIDQEYQASYDFLVN